MVNLAIVIAVLIAVVAISVAALETLSAGRRQKALDVTPEQVLEMRFAKGEIDEEEFARRLSILTFGPPMELSD